MADQKGNQIQVRTEIFEHSIYPTPSRLTLISLVNLFQSLNLLTNIENKISLEVFRDNVVKHIPSMSPVDAEVYFQNYKVLVEEDTAFLQSSNKQQIMADVRGLSIYFFLQLYTVQARHNFNMDMGLKGSQFNEGVRGNLSGNLSHNFSPLNSPRSKTIRAPQLSNDQQQNIYFVKYNLKTILKLVSNDINNDETLLSQNEFNLMSLLLSPVQKKITLSQLTGLYKSANRVQLSQLNDFINKNINSNETTEVSTIQGLTKAVTIKEDSAYNQRDLKITACEDSYIYIDSCVQSVSITGCVNCTIFIAAVKKVCTVEKCEKVNLTVASNLLRIGNTVDSNFFYFGAYSPILYGDNKSIQLGPNNANYNELYERIKQSKIPLTAKSISNFSTPIVMNQNQNITFQIIKPQDLYPLILPPNQFRPIHHSLILQVQVVLQPNFEKNVLNPSQNQEITNLIVPLMAPNEFRETMINRYKAHSDLQISIKKSGLNDDQQKVLHQAIQGLFREWLQTSGQSKPITELVKLIDQE